MELRYGMSEVWIIQITLWNVRSFIYWNYAMECLNCRIFKFHCGISEGLDIDIELECIQFGLFKLRFGISEVLTIEITLWHL